MCNRFCRGLLAVLLAGQSLVQAAEPLSLQVAIERSLSRNPELKAQGYDVAIQTARLEQASAKPPLEIGFALENAFGTGVHEGVDAAETTLSLGWQWERGAREKRMDVAQAGAAVVENEAQLRRLDVATETARCFLAVLTHQQELGELQRALHVAEEAHSTVQARVAAARAPEAEAARAYAQLARAKLDFEHEEHELLTAAVRLTAMWAESNDAEDVANAIEVRGDLFVLPPLESLSQLRARLQRNPSLSRLVTTQRLREAELQLATAQRRPAWQFTAGVRRLEATDDAALVFGLTAPLGNTAYSRGSVAVARAQAEQSRTQGESLNVQLGSELFALYQELKHAYTEVTALRDEVLPRMQAALEQSRYAYERGRYSYLEWTAAQREVNEVRRALISAAANAQRYRIEIERLTGAELAPPAQ